MEINERPESSQLNEGIFRVLSISRVVDAESCHVELQQLPIGESIHRFGGRLRLAIGVDLDLDVVTQSNLSVAVKKSLTPIFISLRCGLIQFNSLAVLSSSPERPKNHVEGY